MAGPDLSTRAPENDMMEDESLDTPITTSLPSHNFPLTYPTTHEPSSPSHHQTQAPRQEQQPPTPTATLHEHCTSDRPLQPGQRPTGTISTYSSSNTETYISKPADYPSTPARLLLVLTNGRGVHSTNNQLQADSFAQHGFVVVMPDMFAGDAAPNTAATAATDAETSWLDTIKARVVETSKSFMIDMWLARHTAETVMPILAGVLEGVREEFADAVAHGGGVYAVGYCFGGKFVLLLAGEGALQGQSGNEEGGDEDDVEKGMVGKKGPEIKCGAVAHGTLVTREDLKGVKVPVSLVCVEDDPLFPEEVLEFGKNELSTNQVEHEVKVYPGVPHGFAVVGEYDSAVIQEAQTAASAQMLNWLQSH